MNTTTSTKKDTIIEITNVPIKEKKSILLNIIKINNTCQNYHIYNILVIKPYNKLITLTQTFLLFVITL